MGHAGAGGCETGSVTSRTGIITASCVHATCYSSCLGSCRKQSTCLQPDSRRHLELALCGMLCCLSIDEDEAGGGGRRSPKQARGRRSFESDSILQTRRRVTVSELDLLKSKSAVTSTLRGLLKDSMGQVSDASPDSRATRARAA